MPGLRERKKRETRQRISDVATGMFLMHGFAKVTVAQVAELANVSKMTVFNYFARKEDMLFDREGEIIDRVQRAIVERPAGATPLAAMHALFRRLLSDSYPVVAVSAGARAFWKMVEASATLRARSRELTDNVERALAEALSAAVDAAPDDADAELAAAMIWAVQRVAYRVGMASIDRGDAAESVRRRQRDVIERGFAIVTAGLGATPFGRPPRRSRP